MTSDAGLATLFLLVLADALGVPAPGDSALFVAGALASDGSTPVVAIILVATSLGVVVPVLKDAGRASSMLGQLVIAAASIADFGAVILLSLLFSREATSTTTKLVLLGGFALVVLAFGIAIVGAGRSRRLGRVLVRLQDTTAQIRVRGAFLLLVAFVALAERLGLEVILGAFLAGAILSLVDRDREMTHPAFRAKLEAVGFGVFIPVFFVSSGIAFDLDALFASTSTAATPLRRRPPPLPKPSGSIGPGSSACRCRPDLPLAAASDIRDLWRSADLTSTTADLSRGSQT